jgi:hypothetical protein
MYMKDKNIMCTVSTKILSYFQIVNTDLPLSCDRDWRRVFVCRDVFKDAVRCVRPDELRTSEWYLRLYG